jgi:spermidine synthase
MPLWAIGASVIAVVSAFFIWPHFLNGYHTGPFVLLWAVVWFSFLVLASQKKAFIAVLAGIILAAPALESIWQSAHFIIKKRNYYGVYEVYDGNFGVKALVRTLVHGSTMHGVEFIDEKLQGIPVGYYSPTSAIGALLTADVFGSRRVGAVGLGTGTIAMYAKPSCPMDFYELDNDVYQLASRYFWYLAKAPGKVQVTIGDARLSLKKAPDAYYDLLIIDAFSGDSIPTHLINKDVIVEYRQKLSSRGGVVFHITNRYLNLEPVLANIARATGALAAVKEVPSSGVNLDSTWCILTWDKARFARLTSQEGWHMIEPGIPGEVRVWSDDYSSILPIIDWDAVIGPLKSFKLLVW